MYLTVHATTGIVIGQSIINPWGAFLIGLLSHYILDFIPHGDEKKFKNASVSFMAKAAIVDHMFVFIMFLTLFLFKPNFTFTLNIILAIIGAMLPDWLSAVYRLSEKTNVSFFKFLHKITKPLQNFHQFCHYKIIKYELDFYLGTALQIMLLIGFWWVI